MLSYLGWKSSPAQTSTQAQHLESERESQSCAEDEDEPVLSVDVAELRNLLLPLPTFAWQRVTYAYTQAIIPMYSTLCRTINEDVDHLAQIFADLELASVSQASSENDIEEADAEDSGSHAVSDSSPEYRQPELPYRKRRRSHSSGSTSELVIPSSNPSIPTIVVTPCPSQLPETSCWVPFQDASFGNLLTVPTHPVVNDIFPPQSAKPSPIVEKWVFTGGHWRAILPSLEEQIQKGMFSRPMFSRRRRSYVYNCPRSTRSANHKSL